MLGIYYKDGVYVLIDNDEEHEDCAYHIVNKNDVTLYGGRVKLERYDDRYYHQCISLIVDGIYIVRIDQYDMKTIEKLDLPMVVRHLNAIETNGVDAFLLYYKENLELLQEDLMKLKQGALDETLILKDDKLIEGLIIEIQSIEKILFYILGILFILRTFMSAGLENEKVISVYQSIMETIT